MAAVPNLVGYDYDFVAEVPDKLKCAICLLVLKDPLQFSRCGHRFCKLCIQPILKPSGSPLSQFNCPNDRRLTTKNEVFEDTACKREVLDLLVKCPFSACTWSGELRNVEGHMSTCLLETVKCSNARCKKYVLRRDLHKHQTKECLWRHVQCCHCLEFYVQHFAEIHFNSCKQFPITCPNKCGKYRTPREEMERHAKTDCPRAIVQCRHKNVGCTAKFERSALQDHERENVQMHLRLACSELKAVRNQVANVFHGPTSTKFIWKITDYSEKLQAAKSGKTECLWSEPFYTAPPGYKIKVLFYPNGFGDAKNTSVSALLLMKNGEYDAILPWPFQCRVTITFFDQEKDAEKKNNYIASFVPNITTSLRPRYIMCPPLASQEKLGKSFIADDTIFLQVEIEKPVPSRKRQRSDVGW